MDNGSAYIFINREQAAGFGHIGWGFQMTSDQFCFGSTDHLWNTKYPLWHPLELIRYMDVRPGANNDFWIAVATEEEMLQTMRHGHHVRYHSYKKFPVPDPQPLSAKAYAESMREDGWNVIQNNCVHQTYKIITAYGGDLLPDPFELSHRFPKTWFAQIPADEQIISQPSHNLLDLHFGICEDRQAS